MVHAGLRRPRSSCRDGFTLLEVLLAMAIGVLLLGALYGALRIQLHHAQAGRDVVDESALARALLSRIGNDVALSLAPVPAPSSATSSGATAGGTAGSTGASGSTAGASGSSTGASASATSSSPNATTTASPSTSGTFVFGGGVQGSAGVLILYVSRVPSASLLPPGDPQAAAPGADLRRVSYWLASGGLARQEVVLVTADDATANVPPNVPDEGGLVIADEVRNVTFSYFDGSAWQDSWDGTTPGADGVTPIGPPLAVAITLEVARPVSDGGEAQTRTYRHVVAIPTAAGAGQPATTGTRSGS